MKLQNRKHVFFLSLTLVIAARFAYLILALLWNRVASGDASLFTLLFQWDAGWYQELIEGGYALEPHGHPRGDAANWAFFPLYPLMVRFLMRVIPLPTEQMGPLISSFLHVLLIYSSIQYIRLTRNEEASAFTLALLLAFGPYTFYYASLYTESLYSLLVVVSLILLAKDKWVPAGITGAFLSATRPTGVILCLPALIRMLRSHRQQHGRLFTFPFALIKDPEKFLGLLLIPAGLFAYMTFLYFHTGDSLAFSRIQLAWGRTNGNPLGVLLSGFFTSKSAFYLAAWGLLGLVAACYLFRQKRYEEATFGLVTLLIPMASSLMGLPRYFLGSLVLVFACNDLLQRFSPLLRRAALASLMILNATLLFLWFAGHPLMI